MVLLYVFLSFVFICVGDFWFRALSHRLRMSLPLGITVELISPIAQLAVVAAVDVDVEQPLRQHADVAVAVGRRQRQHVDVDVVAATLLAVAVPDV